MFVVNDDLSIYATRGDTIFFRVTAKDHGTPYIFKPGDIVRMSVTAKKDVGKVYLQKDFQVDKATKTVFIYLEEKDTNFGKKMNKHEDFWYEIVLNPDTVPQTIIGYDDDGPKIFRVYPDAEEIDPALPEPEEIPVVDAELDLTSHRPVSNHAVSVAIAKLTAAVEELKGIMPEEETPAGSAFNAAGQVEGLSIVTIDAYGVAVRNGFEGTEEEWLASLQGIQGIPGAAGYSPVRGIDYWTEEDKAEMMAGITVLTDAEIEMLDYLLMNGAPICSPKLTATYRVTSSTSPTTYVTTYRCKVDVAINSIAKSLIQKVEVATLMAGNPPSPTNPNLEWKEATVTFDDIDHSASFSTSSTNGGSWQYGMGVKLTYYDVFGETHELYARAVSS